MNKLEQAVQENEVDPQVLKKVLGEDFPPVARPKQVIVMRKDLNMRKGKLVAQGAHAAMAAVTNRGTVAEIDGDNYLMIPVTAVLDAWLISGIFAKVVVYVNSEAELDAVYEKAKAAGLTAELIIDNGLTEFNGVKTKTCCAIGPTWPDQFKGITDHLPLY